MSTQIDCLINYEPAREMLPPQARVTPQKIFHQLVTLVLVQLYQKQLELKMVLFDLATVKAHQGMKEVSNPITKIFTKKKNIVITLLQSKVGLLKQNP